MSFPLLPLVAISISKNSHFFLLGLATGDIAVYRLNSANRDEMHSNMMTPQDDDFTNCTCEYEFYEKKHIDRKRKESANSYLFGKQSNFGRSVDYPFSAYKFAPSSQSSSYLCLFDRSGEIVIVDTDVYERVKYDVENGGFGKCVKRIPYNARKGNKGGLD